MNGDSAVCNVPPMESRPPPSSDILITPKKEENNILLPDKSNTTTDMTNKKEETTPIKTISLETPSKATPHVSSPDEPHVSSPDEPHVSSPTPEEQRVVANKSISSSLALIGALDDASPQPIFLAATDDDSTAASQGEAANNVFVDTFLSQTEQERLARVRQRVRQKEHALSLLLNHSPSRTPRRKSSIANNNDDVPESSPTTNNDDDDYKLPSPMQTPSKAWKYHNNDNEDDEVDPEEVYKITDVTELQNQVLDLKNRLSFMRGESITKTEQIEYFEYDLLQKNKEMDELREELTEKLKRVFELEVELDIHDLKPIREEAAAMAAKHAASVASLSPRRSVATENRSVVESVHSKESSPTKSKRPSFLGRFARRRHSTAASVATTETHSAVPNHYQQTLDSYETLISKLHSALQLMESRYKDAKLESALLMEELEQENAEYRRKILSLEKCLQETSDNWNEEFMDEDQNSSLPPSARYFKNSSKQFESQLVAANQSIKKLQEQLETAQQELKENKETTQLELGKMRLEKEAMATRLQAGEAHAANYYNHHKCVVDQDHLYATMEKKIHYMFEEVSDMRKESHAKDYKITALRTQIVNLRMNLRQKYANTNESPTSAAAAYIQESNIHHSPKSKSSTSEPLDDVQSTKSTERTDMSLVADLQRQLHETHCLLQEKERELEIERAKSSAAQHHHSCHRGLLGK